MTNPYVFIVGCPRSGTTLLKRMVDAHPHIAITRETHWIPVLIEHPGALSRDGFVTAKLLDALAAHRKFGSLGLPRADLERLLAGSAPLTYAAFVSTVFDLYGRRCGKELVGDKTPNYVRKIAILHRLWPEARFVHLIRDGRDVCLSALAWERKAEDLRRRYPTWADDPVTTAALWWRWHVQLGRQEGSRLAPTLYQEVRYEALVADPEAECRKLCAFLQVAYDDRMVRYHEGRVRSKPGLSAKRAWLPPVQGLRDWRTEMPADALEQVEAVAGELLDELGYGRAVLQPREELLADAARVSGELALEAMPGAVVVG